MLKLQSAIEYLTTYGWAILIIAVALVALFELGIFNRAPPTQCILEGGFGCSDYYLTTNGVLVFNLEQQTTNPVNITGIACYENSTLLPGQKPYNPPSNQIFMPIGSSDTFYAQCYTTNTLTYSGNIGSTFTGTLAIYYTDAITHYTELVKGSLIVPVSTNEQIAQQSSLSAENSIPIVITDTTSYAIPAGFQEMLSINPTSYQIYGLNQNLSNVEFTTGQDGSGVPIYAWIESGASNSASNTIIWLKLPSGITSNGGIETVYMNFLTNNNPVTSGYTGYAPQLWCASGCFQTGYGKYDNGVNVFNNYWNFTGTSIPNGWQTSTTGLVDNGLTLQNSEWAQTSSTNYGINSQQIIDYYASTPYVTACGWFGFGYYTVSSGNGLTWGADACTGSHTIFPLVTGPNAPEYNGDQVASAIPSGNYLLSVYWGTNGNNEFYYNYIPYASDSTPSTLPTVTTGLGGIWNDANAIIIDYIRERDYPPSGVMPPTTSYSPSSYFSVSITPSSTEVVDNGQNIAFTSSVSGGKSPYSYQWYSSTTSSCSSSSTKISGATSSSYSTSPSSTTYYCVVVTDSETPSKSATSGTTEVSINPTLSTPSISPSNPSISSGGSVSFTSSWSGGTPDYTAKLYSSSTSTCNTGSTLVQTLSSLSSGSASFSSVSPTTNTYYCIFVTDSATTPETTNSINSEVTVTTSSSLSVSISPSGSPYIDNGQSLTLSSSVSGGTSPYTYQWYEGESPTGSPISGATSSTYSASPISATPYYVSVKDSESPAQEANSISTTVVVNSALGVPSISPSNPSISSGGSVSFTSSWTGGTPDYTAKLYSSSTSTCNTGSTLVQTLSSLSSGSASFSSVSPTTNTYYCIFVTDSATSPETTNSINSEVTIQTQQYAYYVPVSISNDQSNTVPSNFQQMIYFNPSLSQYSSNEMSNLSNLELTSIAPIGTSGNVPLYAWIESGASKTATNTIIWVNLGSNTINAAGSGSNTLTIYLNFLTNNNPVINGYTGYAPELYCSSGCFQTTYAEYDIGPKIFNFYDNFTGTTLNSNLWISSPKGVSLNNGLKINGTGQADILNNSIESKKTFNMVSNTIDGYLYFTDLSGTNSYLEPMQYVGWVNPTHQSFVIADNCGTNSFNLYDIPYGGTSCLSPASSITSYNLLSLWETPNTYSYGNVENLSSNYNFGIYGTDNIYSNAYETGTASLNISSSAGTANYIYVQWIDIRTTPPNSVMPAAIIGS